MAANTEPNRTDSPSPPRVVVDQELTFSRRDVGGRTAFVVHQPSTGKYFQLGAEEYRVARLLDGNRTLTDIVAALQADGITWTPDRTAEFVSKLVTSRLARTIDTVAQPPTPDHASASAAQAASPAGPRSRPLTWSQRLPKLLSLTVSQRIPLMYGDAPAERLRRVIGSVFSGRGVVGWSLLAISSLIITSIHSEAFADELRRMFDPQIWIVLLCMWVIAKVIHEAGHAVAARYHGVRVGKVGVMFFFLAPLAYVDVTDAWKLPSRWKRVQIAAAGVYLEWILASLSAWAWLLLPDGYARHLAAQCFLVAGPGTLLVNANPLLRLDGYYILSDLTEIPNLRMHGRRQLVGLLERLLLRIPSCQPLLSGWRWYFATVHAACSVVFQIAWMSGLVIAVSMWAEGLGLLLAFSAIMLWVLLPLVSWFSKIWRLESAGAWELSEKRRRLVAVTLCGFVIVQYLWVSSSPFARRVPVVVQFRDPQIARASADAFVNAVLVESGQRVKAGMQLVELDDPELRIRREEKADELRIAELREIQLRRKGELAASAAETENAASLRRQLDELDQQIDGLRVTATREGIVIGSRLQNLRGSFVQQGDELLRVSDPNQKELLVAINESDVQAYQRAVTSGKPAAIRLRGGTKLAAVPAAVRPRARRTLPHPALAATSGGPLAVEPSPEEGQDLRVVDPQLHSVTPLDAVTSANLHDGQIGTMVIADTRSLISRVWDSFVRQGG